MKAIAAMSKDRVIGKNGVMPWHFSPDLQFFKRTTLGHIVVMGRRTYESIGKPLPGRENLVLTSGNAIPGVCTIASLAEIPRATPDGREIFIIGGAQLYTALLPECSSVYLTILDCEVAGDTWFPPFEDQFPSFSVIETGASYEIRHYLR